MIDRLAGSKGLTVTRSAAPEIDDSGMFTGFYTSSFGADDFDTAVSNLFKANGIVFACVTARQMPFSEVRFQFQEVVNGRPGDLFNTPELDLLDKPWPNGTTGEMLSRMEQDASIAGNFYATVVGEGADRRLRRLRPDWVYPVTGIPGDTSDAAANSLEGVPLGYIYDPAGRGDGVLLAADRVVHYTPIPDPEYHWRGMSWLTPLVREIHADTAATVHKQKFFQNGAALSTVVSYDKALPAEQFERYVQLFREAHEGADNAYRTLHIGGGADVSVIGTEMKSDFRAIQGAGETRIAAAAGVGAIIARFSEGLAGSALNQGNYAAAKRQFADMTLRPLWRTAAASLSKLVPPPRPNVRLWYDARDVEFLKEDRNDAATILQTTAQTISTLVTAGYTPESVITAVETNDLKRLVHSGLYSVQLHSSTPDADGAPQDIASILQKIYLAVDAGVVTRDEARLIANRAGAALPA